MTIAISCAIFALATNEWPELRIRYTDSFESHYGQILEQRFVFPDDMPLASEETIESPRRLWRLYLQTTDTTKVGPDKVVASLVFERYDGEKRYLMIPDFRFVEVTWVNDRLLYIVTDIGHIAGVGQLYDVEANEWLYQRGESYFYQGDMKPPEHP